MADLFQIGSDRAELHWSTARGGERPTISGIDPPPGRLRITPRRPGINFVNIYRAGLPPEVASDVTFRGGPRLFEQSSYKIILQSLTGEAATLRHRDPNVTTDVDTGFPTHGTINFKNQVGLSRFTVFVGESAEFEFEVEVFPTKLDYATDYHEMLAEIREILTTLALEYLRATEHFGGARSVSTTSELDWLTILRHVIGDLERALRQIARQPVRSITREPSTVAVERLKRIDSGVRRTLDRPPQTSSRTRLSSGREVVARIDERRPHVTLDTPEHRWLALQLLRIRRRLAQVLKTESERDPSPRLDRTLAELVSFERRIAALEALEPIQEAQRLPVPGFVSLQLLKANGYREAYIACVFLSMALHLDGDAFRLTPKEINVLYEYWCFLKLAGMLSASTGQPIDARKLIKVEQNGLRVTLKKGISQTLAFDAGAGRKISITYNREYSNGSLLLTQKPDFSIAIEEGNWPRVELVLDAKYRIDASERYAQQYGSPGPPEDALNVLHRYRDAILIRSEPREDRPWRSTVVQAAALFPYRDRTEGAFARSRLWRTLEEIGIGAIPLLPQSDGYLQEWLNSILRLGGWSLAERAIPHVSEERLWNWRRAAAEPVLIGVLRGGRESEHLDWIRSSQMYYTRLTKQARLLAVEEVAIYLSAALRTPGCVCLHSLVRSIEIRPRREIDTPWTSRRSSDELQVLFHLGDVRDHFPIKNLRGERFSDNRWSSRLALQRASSLVELFLETEPEWRLYETLEANRILFHLEPGRVDLQDGNDVRGRAWFVVGDARIQYRGAAGFLFRQNAIDQYVSGPNSVIAFLKEISGQAQT